MGVRLFLQSRRPFGVALRCGDMGVYPPHRTVPGGIPRPSDMVNDSTAAMAEVGQKMSLHLSGGGKRGCGVQANGNLHLEKAEYGRAVYCDAANSGPVRDGR